MAVNDNILIVRLHQSRWSPWGYDKQAAKETAQKEGAKEGDVHTTKRKISKEAIKKITDILSKAYAFHIENTMPSGTEGDRLITTNLYEKYVQKMDEFKSQFYAEVEKFIPQYPQWIQEARERLKGLFKEEDYPTVNEIRSKFSMTYHFLPMPSSDHISVNLLNGQLSKVKQSVEEEMKRIQETAMKSLWDRIYENISRMAERLSDKDAIFRDSLIENVRDLCEVLKSLNFKNDPDLEAMRQRIETRLAGADPEVLRKFRNVRLEVAQEAKAIVAEISEKRKLRLE